ncbi:ubiquitin carboxyl-hydrolase [Actinomyces johnsonii]|uniref:Ubiquitin carboxyl-hydrolase n=1 Tax=Actinomyces johnsonii TaxID=544581 RepID=A0A508A746_9ACTO|nr:ubiquitin carboxyl-hydrolase [Actinomyces johnsonii]KAA8744258.1 ubiquitin carboxyl-hydrolase [Actinomyces johnsonii]TQD43698.1 ubiquitin carboxyl-hydrolase [Actinomyces johnsonii]
MGNLLHRFGRGRVVATVVVVVTSGLLLGVTRMVFFHPAESVSEPGIVMTGTPATSPQSSTSAPDQISDSASNVSHDQGGAEAGSSIPSTQGHSPQAVEPDPPVAVDHGSRQSAPAAPSAPAAAGKSDDSRTEIDDDDDKSPAKIGATERDDDDRDIDD